MVSVEGKTAVDAAHIHQFTKGGADDPRNGLALSKTAHWLFDRGFWSIGDDYTVLVKGDQFDEAGGRWSVVSFRTPEMSPKRMKETERSGRVIFLSPFSCPNSPHHRALVSRQENGDAAHSALLASIRVDRRLEPAVWLFNRQ
jgi:hypothetical protein